MGEYAIRKSDGERIKIGTCEDMYYLRYEDRAKVRALSGNVDPEREATALRFRLPFPDEDGLEPGSYEDYNRGVLLFRGNEYFTDDETANDPGNIQLTHPSGLLVNVPCYHGAKLPALGDARVFWNGKSPSLEMRQLRPTDGGVKPIVACRWCNGAWRYDWSDIWEYIHDPALRIALCMYREAEAAAAAAATV